MPRVSTIGLLKWSEQPTLVVRTATSVQICRTDRKVLWRDRGLSRRAGRVSGRYPIRGLSQHGYAKSRCRMGFPVSSKLSGRGDIVQGSIPEGLNVSPSSWVLRPMESVYSEMAEWITDSFLPESFMSIITTVRSFQKASTSQR